MLTGGIEGARPMLVAIYGAWATKILVIDSDMNPAFTTLAVALSIYGLWICVRRTSDFVIEKLLAREHRPSSS
jgi:hypothetical protein